MIGRDWQNSYADFAANLKRELAHIRDNKAREAAVADMRAVLERYTELTGRAAAVPRWSLGLWVSKAT